MAIYNVATPAENWLRAPQPIDAFTQWVRNAPPAVRMAFAGLGPGQNLRPGDGDWYDFLRPHMERLIEARGPILNMLRSDEWRPAIQDALDHVRSAIGDPSPPIDVYVTLGVGCRQVSQGYRDGRGIAYVWLEHFLEHGYNAPFLHLGLRALPLWTAHAVGHALRYALDGTRSALGAVVEDDPWDFWKSLDSLSLAERFLDEGLAIEFSRATSGLEGVENALGLSTVELDWLRDNDAALMRDRLDRWDFEQESPARECLRDAFFHDPDRFEPPWSIERPPVRWGYYAGWRFFAGAAAGDWRTRLGASAPSILQAVRSRITGDNHRAA